MSDKTELQRQLMQILYTEAFIKEQSKQAEPMEMIFLSIGHNMHKHDLIKQWPKPLLSLAYGEMDSSSKDVRDVMEITGAIKVVNQESNKHLKNTRHQKQGHESNKDS